MSNYDLKIDDVMNCVLIFLKCHNESYVIWKGLDLRRKIPKTVLCCDDYLSSYGKLNRVLLSPPQNLLNHTVSL